MQELCKKNVKKLQKRFFPYICGMEKLRHGSLFSGIGGFDLAAEWMGWDNIFHCEWNEFSQKVLKHYWPQAESFSDITKTDFTKYYGTVDIITGGFPCQPYSSAGKRLGKEDERHLWPEMLRAIREVSPRFVVGENVRGLTNWNGGMVFEEVCAELESYGYQVAPVIIPACAVNAPHRRERIWFVAYADGSEQRDNKRADNRETEKVWREKERNVFRELPSYGDASNADSWRLERTTKIRRHSFDAKWKNENNESRPTIQSQSKRLQEPAKNGELERPRSKFASERTNWDRFPTQSPVCSRDDGFPGQLDGITFPKWRNETIKAYGNAIVPQVEFQIFKALEKSLYL